MEGPRTIKSMRDELFRIQMRDWLQDVLNDLTKIHFEMTQMLIRGYPVTTQFIEVKMLVGEALDRLREGKIHELQ